MNRPKQTVFNDLPTEKRKTNAPNMYKLTVRMFNIAFYAFTNTIHSFREFTQNTVYITASCCLEYFVIVADGFIWFYGFCFVFFSVCNFTTQSYVMIFYAFQLFVKINFFLSSSILMLIFDIFHVWDLFLLHMFEWPYLDAKFKGA